MKALALVEARNHVCCRYRVRAFEGTLAASGWSLAIEPLETDLFPAPRPDRPGGRVRRRHPPAEAPARLAAPRAPQQVEEADLRFRRRRPLPRLVRSPGAAPSPPVGSLQADGPGRARCRDRGQCVPGRLRPGRWGRPEPRPGDPDLRRRRGRPARSPAPAGGRGGRPGLESARAAPWPGSTGRGRSWERLGREVPGLRLRMVCDHFLRFESLPVVDVPWSEATEAADVASADIGISWVPDDLWSRGKCGLKVLQYQAAGLPVVANPVGVHPEIIRPGVDGLLPRDGRRVGRGRPQAGPRPRSEAADGPGGPILPRGELLQRVVGPGLRRRGGGRPAFESSRADVRPDPETQGDPRPRPFIHPPGRPRPLSELS